MLSGYLGTLEKPICDDLVAPGLKEEIKNKIKTEQLVGISYYSMTLKENGAWTG